MPQSDRQTYNLPPQALLSDFQRPVLPEQQNRVTGCDWLGYLSDPRQTANRLKGWQQHKHAADSGRTEVRVLPEADMAYLMLL
ncbi:hypothetical protein AFL22_09685 [Pantoea sp. CFSAN033090]|jgi:hypothetical protein|nr:hypothetical protein AFL22_09685 [Pantoea sp. CFSAN033090]